MTAVRLLCVAYTNYFCSPFPSISNSLDQLYLSRHLLFSCFREALRKEEEQLTARIKLLEDEANGLIPPPAPGGTENKKHHPRVNKATKKASDLISQIVSSHANKKQKR